MPNKRKRRANKHRMMKFEQHKYRKAENKLRREKKRQRIREFWANCTEYLKKQARKGYKKIDGKWRREVKE